MTVHFTARILSGVSALVLATGGFAPRLNAQAPKAVSAPYRVSATGAGNSYAPVFSADGRSVAFLSHANNLVTNDDLGTHLDLFVRDLAARNTVLVSANTNGIGGANDNISLFALSSNGQVVAFETAASNLTVGDNNGLGDIFARDLVAGATALVSVNADGTGPGNGRSYNPRVSADGRYVVFESLASNLITNDFNGTNDVFLRDLVAGTTTLISLNSDGTASGDGPSHSPSISANGLVVAFVSSATNLVDGVTNRAGEIYVRDAAAGVTRWARASHVVGTYEPVTRYYSAFEPTLSADGRFVVFKTQRGLVVRFDTTRPTNRIVLAFPGVPMVTDSNYFVFQDNPRLVGPITAPGASSRTTPGGFGDGTLDFTPDGRYAAFTTGTNAPGLQQSVLRADFEDFATNIILYCCDGTSTFFYTTSQVPVLTVVSTNFGIPHFVPPVALAPAMSDDARRILFLSDGANATGMSSGTVFRVYLRDMDTNVLDLVSTNRSGAASSVVSDTLPALTGDGRLIGWESADPNLVPDDLNGAFDVFVRDLTTGETTLVSAAHPALPPTTGKGLASTGPGSFSANGTLLALATLDSSLALEDTNTWRDGFLCDLRTGSNLFVTGPRFPVIGPTGPQVSQYQSTNHATVPQLSAEGRYALFDGVKPTAVNFGNHTLVWRDLLTGTNFIVAQSDSVSRAVLSPAGQLVFFDSATPANQFGVLNAVEGNNVSDIFAWNASAAPTEPRMRVLSTSRFGAATGNEASLNPVLSPDGCWLAFVSRASDLTPDSSGSTAFQVFARGGLCHPTNSFLGTNLLISYRTMASIAPDGTSLDQPWPTGGTNPVFSANNRYVFFKDGASNVIYRHDFLAQDIVTITAPLPGRRFTNIARVTNLTVCTGCLNPSPTADGRFVAYEVPGTSGLTNIVLQDIVSGATELISQNLAGAGGGNGPSFTPLQSYDGRFVFFASKASDLVANDTNRATDIFVRDRLAGVTHCLSMNRFGTATGNRVSSQPVLSPDGRSVAFQSFASDLVAGDYNDTRDVFLVTLGGSDTDGDGMEDDWEVAYFNDLSRDGTGDFDGDGASDSSEFRAGTDPTNSGSVFRVISLTTYIAQSAQQTTTLLWAATPGRAYRVQTKSEDLSGPWIDLPGDVVATGTSATKYHITTAGSSSRSFYRVLLVP